MSFKLIADDDNGGNMIYYKDWRIIDGKLKLVIVEENGKIVNKNPSKEDLKPLENEKHKDGRCRQIYTDEELLNYLRQFYKENGRVPIANDFDNNPRYPNYISIIDGSEVGI